MWLIAGLGNPGAEYAANRHNLGYRVADELARRGGATFGAVKGVRALAARTRLGALPGGVPGPGAVLLKPTGYMNTSGDAVAFAARYFDIAPDRIIAVHDDLDLDFGRVRLRSGGGEGGHNGLRSITKSVGTHDYLRVRLGIGRPPGRQDPADFVLKDFASGQREEADLLVQHGADAVEELVADGLDAAQLHWHTDT